MVAGPALMAQKGSVLSEQLVKPFPTLACSSREYSLPVPRAQIQDFGSWGYSPAHQGNLRNSIDFYAPEGTPVLAAASGKVVDIRTTSYESGIATFFWDRGNFIEIEHENGEYTHYEHMLPNSTQLKVGDRVVEGQIIGRVGKTGFADKPHLHFQVHKYIENGGGEMQITLRARLLLFPDVYSLDLIRLGRGQPQ
jgi:murein DD-endopeptidase MepM/ murein hydrolase activator NlpD